MRFLVDAQPPPYLATWLKERGHDAWHVEDFELRDANDPEIWAKACGLEAHLITKDEDFVAIRERASGGPAVVWLRIGNAVNRVLIPWFAKAFPATVHAIDTGAAVVEVK